MDFLLWLSDYFTPAKVMGAESTLLKWTREKLEGEVEEKEEEKNEKKVVDAAVSGRSRSNAFEKEGI